ncbi:MAG: AIM24 family protein [Micrococcales bacterium]|nr:AIM24 family protein [Micrococcales bacterium]
MTLHGPLFEDFKENTSTDQFSLQGPRMLKIQMGYGPVQCRAGSMVAYQGDVRFARKSQGMERLVKRAVTGEGVPIMEASGQGELFLGDSAANVQIMYMDNDMVTVNGSAVLAFSSSIQWDIQRVKGLGGMMAAGLFNVVLRGTGFVAVTTRGEPVALDVASAPTFGDPQAAVLWTAGVTANIRTDTSGGIGSFVRGGTGEVFQVAFGGHGHVLVQPSEGGVAAT